MTVGTLTLRQGRQRKGRFEVETSRESSSSSRDLESVQPAQNSELIEANDESSEDLNEIHPEVEAYTKEVATRETAPTAGVVRAKPGIATNAAASALTDLDLITKFQTGDERAFAQLYGRRQADIFTFCLRMCSGNADLASDAFQETFIKIYEKAHQFRREPGSTPNVMGWMLMVARNTCLNLQRGRKDIDRLDDHFTLASTDRSLSPDFPQEQQFFRDILEEAIASLPFEIREPFVLREFEGFSYADISEQLGITLGATKQRIYRAKQSMREHLSPYFTDGTTGEFNTDSYISGSRLFSVSEDDQS